VHDGRSNAVGVSLTLAKISLGSMKKIAYLFLFFIVSGFIVILFTCPKKQFDEQAALAKKNMEEKRDCNEKLCKANAETASLNDQEPKN
jgi:hypothetical protein